MSSIDTIILDADQLARIDTAARALQAGERKDFVDAVRQHLAGETLIGDGLLHRAIRAAMADHLRSSPLIPDGPHHPMPPKYARVGHFNKAR